MFRKLLVFYLITLLSCSIATENISKTYSDCRKTLYNINVASIEQLRDLVQKFFNKVMKVIQNTDPFSSSHVDLNYHGYGIESDGFLDDLLVSGQSLTNLNHIDVNDNDSLQFSIDLTTQRFQVIGKYKLNFNMMTMLPLFGSGDLGIAMSGLHFSIQATFKELLDKRLQLTDFQLDYNVNDVKVDINNVFNNTNIGTYLSHLLSDVIPLTLNDLPPLKTFGGIGLKAALNSLLCDNAITLSFIIEFMQKFIQ